ncbi:MAG TPA: phosphomannomutase/phosphoglucomutase, partial [Chromatiales bacterium]|nr:phosphomannomutase/phosphoglucomutase [Chromatiales bacterium]
FEHPAQALGFMHRFAERFDTRDAREVLTIDGLRVEYPDGWFLVRPSNTMPAIVLRMEADDGAALERIRDRVRQAFQTIEPDRPLPF